MLTSKDKQNLNEKEFSPRYGQDKNGVQYSCGHINPLQKALINNGTEQIKKVSRALKIALNGLENYNKQILEFAKNRCEEIRSINIELRNVTKKDCSCLDDYECSSCDDFRDDIYALEDKIELLKESESELAFKLETLEAKYNDLKEIFDSIS